MPFDALESLPQRARPPARPHQLEHPERKQPASPKRRDEDQNLVPKKSLHASIESRPRHPDLENWPESRGGGVCAGGVPRTRSREVAADDERPDGAQPPRAGARVPRGL